MMTGSAIAREARVLRLCLELGLVELEQIERWADAVIVQLDPPTGEFSMLCAARLQGASVCRTALEVTGGKATSIDVVAALARVDAADFSMRRTKELVEALVGWAIQLNEDSDAGKLLFQAYELYDEFHTPPEWNYAPDERRVRKMLTDFVGRARELAAKAGS